MSRIAHVEYDTILIHPDTLAVLLEYLDETENDIFVIEFSEYLPVNRAVLKGCNEILAIFYL